MLCHRADCYTSWKLVSILLVDIDSLCEHTLSALLFSTTACFEHTFTIICNFPNGQQRFWITLEIDSNPCFKLERAQAQAITNFITLYNMAVIVVGNIGTASQICWTELCLCTHPPALSCSPGGSTGPWSHQQGCPNYIPSQVQPSAKRGLRWRASWQIQGENVWVIQILAYTHQSFPEGVSPRKTNVQNVTDLWCLFFYLSVSITCNLYLVLYISEIILLFTGIQAVCLSYCLFFAFHAYLFSNQVFLVERKSSVSGQVAECRSKFFLMCLICLQFFYIVGLIFYFTMVTLNVFCTQSISCISAQCKRVVPLLCLFLPPLKEPFSIKSIVTVFY